MSDWNPQVVIIESIEKHPDADALDIATVLGNYPVIVKTGEYMVGQTAAYMCLDTVLPDTEQFHFMSPVLRSEDGQILGRKYNVGSVPDRYRIVKAKKIRGIFSMGLLVPAPIGLDVGDSIVEFFNLTKWEEEEEENIPSEKVKTKTQNEKRPEGWSIPYYDKESLRKYASCLLPDEQIVLTEKIHGANASFCHDGSQLWCKSRNYYKRGIISFTDGEGINHQVESTDQWWQAARFYSLEDRLSKYPGLVFFGEIAGQVKGFRYDAKIIDGKLQPCLYFFDILESKTMKYLDYDDRVSLIKELELTPAPELYRGPWLGKEKMFPFAEGRTTTGGKHCREGFVLNTLVERFEPRLKSRMTVKLVGEEYSLNK